MESNVRYYSRRAAEERSRARMALTDAARERHSELAILFEGKALGQAPESVRMTA